MLVFGESRHEHERWAKFGSFDLGGEKVPAKVEYDHMGIKNCLFDISMPEMEERISKGRRAFTGNAIARIVVKKKGHISACSVMY